MTLLHLVETVKKEGRFPTRIVKYTVFPWVCVIESVSGFFESVDSVLSLSLTKLSENQIPRFGLLLHEPKAEPNRELESSAPSPSDSYSVPPSSSTLASSAALPVFAGPCSMIQRAGS